MNKVQRGLFAVSLTAVWCLLMPPYLYGVIGVLATFLSGYAVGKYLPDYKSIVKNNFKVWHLVFLAFVFYMFIEEFVDQWTLSSKMEIFANLFGITVVQFLNVAGIFGSIVSLYAGI